MSQENHLALVCALSKWVETHLGRVIYLEELAAYSGYSLWHMQKIFKDVTGVSLGKYIRERLFYQRQPGMISKNDPVLLCAIDQVYLL